MASTCIFSLPVPAYRQSKPSLTDGLQARKRKRTQVDENDKTKSIGAFRRIENSQQVHPQQVLQFSEYSAVLTPEERSQYRVAGQPLGQKLLRKPFPHGPQSQPDECSNRIQSTSNRLATLDPPIYAPSPDARNLPLHHQHLAALTALLHRTLSEGDFARAGRALSLILRDTINGQELDIRAEGRWGIGAEILLRQGTRADYAGMDLSTDWLNDHENLNKFEQGPPTWFTRKGFEDLRKYYERLIIQYPFNKPHPGAVNALDFYPAMFGIWIYVVQEESKLNNESSGDYTFSETIHTKNSANTDTRPKFNFVSGQSTLAQAREIAMRMDSCMTTIPYSDDLELIRLRGMVSLWIADLIDDLIDNQSTLSDESKDSVRVDVVDSVQFSRSSARGSEDDLSRTLKLEADQAKQKAVEMQRKLQGHLNRLD